MFRVLTEARLGQHRLPQAPLRLLSLCPKDPAGRDGSEPRSRRTEEQKLVTSASFLILTSAIASQTRYCLERDKCHSQGTLGIQSLGTRGFEFSSRLVLGSSALDRWVSWVELLSHPKSTFPTDEMKTV